MKIEKFIIIALCGSIIFMCSVMINSEKKHVEKILHLQNEIKSLESRNEVQRIMIDDCHFASSIGRLQFSQRQHCPEYIEPNCEYGSLPNAICIQSTFVQQQSGRIQTWFDLIFHDPSTGQWNNRRSISDSGIRDPELGLILDENLWRYMKSGIEPECRAPDFPCWWSNGNLRRNANSRGVSVDWWGTKSVLSSPFVFERFMCVTLNNWENYCPMELEEME